MRKVRRARYWFGLCRWVRLGSIRRAVAVNVTADHALFDGFAVGIELLDQGHCAVHLLDRLLPEDFFTVGIDAHLESEGLLDIEESLCLSIFIVL